VIKITSCAKRREAVIQKKILHRKIDAQIGGVTARDITSATADFLYHCLSLQ
jgi:hypothetical protein